MSDNAEAHLQATFAAKSGLEHAGELLKGLEFDDLLRGPDGAYDGSATYLSQAGKYAYRNPLTWVAARALNVDDPAPFVLGLTDDGLLNTGRYGISPGTVLIPLTGVAFRAPRHNGSGLLTTARYFVKVSDNNGEGTERALDPEDNPFLDGDGIIVVRSMGVSRTMRETLGVGVHGNAISVFEGRFKRTRVFNLDAPMVILANEIAPSGKELFSGASFRIDGRGRVGLATVDTAVFDGTSPAQALSSALSPEQSDAIQGAGLRPSIQDITASISGDPDRALLLNPDFLWNLVSGPLTRGADRAFVGNQNWAGGDSPDLGSYDPAKEANDPGQKPRLTVVDGDLAINGSCSGAGLLVVRGKLAGSGSLNYAGLMLILGAGDADINTLDLTLQGGMLVANITLAPGRCTLGSPRLSLGRSSNLTYAREAIKMALRLIPPSRIGWREITTTLDP